LNLAGGGPRQLTQLSYADGFEGNAAWSPDGHTVAFTRSYLPDATNKRGHTSIVLLDVESAATHELSITGVDPFVSDPAWGNDGKEILFVTRRPQSSRGGRVWKVSAAGGQATPVTDESVQALAPALSSDGRLLAHFAPDANGRMQVWKHEIATANAQRITNHADVTATRLRWTADGRSLVYSADGRLWKLAAAGGPPV